jgi:hypothetical protein
MKLVYSMMTGMAAAIPQIQVPQGRFGITDIASIIKNMDASGDQAEALFKQFSALEGFDRSTVSNRPVNTVSSANDDDELGSTNAFLMASGYGCWCFFGDQHLARNAKGAPADRMDELCKQLHNNYECLLQDFEQLGLGECYGWQEDHAINFLQTATTTDQQLVDGCTSQNSASVCKTNACIIEAAFVRDFGILMDGGDFTPLSRGFHYRMNADGQLEENPNHEFFRQDNCYGVPGRDNPAPRCCGSFPNRLVFNANIRGCCNENELYHFGNNMECCPDGTVIEAGSGRTDCVSV